MLSFFNVSLSFFTSIPWRKLTIGDALLGGVNKSKPSFWTPSLNSAANPIVCFSIRSSPTFAR